MKFNLFLMVVLLINYINLNATDTLTYKTKKVEVNSNRILNDVSSKYSANSIITQKMISIVGAVQLSEVLQFTPGLYIKDYGGLGGLKTVSIHSASSNQTSVLLNGMKLFSSQNSVIDLSNIPMSLVSEIEVLRGGNSSVYGGGAMGGAINLLTDKNNYPELKISYGSFSVFQSMIKMNYQINSVNIANSIEYTTSKGDFPFAYSDFGKNITANRSNGNFMNFAFTNNIQTDLSGWNFNNLIMLRTSERGLPGAVLQGKIQNDSAKMNEDEFYCFLSLNRNIKKNTELKFAFFSKYNQSNYEDTETYQNIKNLSNNTFINRELQFQSKYILKDEKNYFDVNFELLYSNLSGDMLDKALNSYVERTGIALSSKYEFELLDNSDLNSSSVFGVRSDFTIGLEPSYSVLTAVIADIKQINLKTNLQISTNFRLPNFNEMYYLNYGNENLKTEKSFNINLGASANILNLFDLDVQAFYIDTKDQIVSVAFPSYWSAQNIERVKTTGIELSAVLNSIDNVYFSISYTLQKASNQSKGNYFYDKQVIYSPNEIFNFLFNVKFGNLNFGLNGFYSSFRYALLSNDLNSVLPEYFLLNSSISYVLNTEYFTTNLRIDIQNLLNTQYSVIINYPMPGRAYKFSLQIKI